MELVHMDRCQKIERKLLKTTKLRISYRGPPVQVPYLSSCCYNQTANSVPQYYRVTLAPPKLPTTASVSCLLFRSFHLKTHKQSRVATHSLTHPHTIYPIHLPPTTFSSLSGRQSKTATSNYGMLMGRTTIHLHGQHRL
jgi:hypothetical protein